MGNRSVKGKGKKITEWKRKEEIRGEIGNRGRRKEGRGSRRKYREEWRRGKRKDRVEEGRKEGKEKRQEREGKENDEERIEK